VKQNLAPLLKSISGLLINLSGVWFALAFITPNFIGHDFIARLMILTSDEMSGIVFLIGSITAEKLLQDYEQQ
jgi:hypothetical protein